MRRSRNRRGFTIIEIVTVVTIISVLTALAVGTLGGITWTQRLNEVAREYYAAATKARAAAMRRAKTSVVQLLLTGPDDDDFVIIAYFDENDNFVFNDGTDELIHRHYINEQFLGGTNAAVSYAEQLTFANGPGSTLITTIPDSSGSAVAVPPTILFNNEGFSFEYGVTQADTTLKAVKVDISDSINMTAVAGGQPLRRLEITVAGAARLRSCDGSCAGD